MGGLGVWSLPAPLVFFSEVLRHRCPSIADTRPATAFDNNAPQLSQLLYRHSGRLGILLLKLVSGHRLSSVTTALDGGRPRRTGSSGIVARSSARQSMF